jgi:hypothetical protein
MEGGRRGDEGPDRPAEIRGLGGARRRRAARARQSGEREESGQVHRTANYISGPGAAAAAVAVAVAVAVAAAGRREGLSGGAGGSPREKKASARWTRVP